MSYVADKTPWLVEGKTRIKPKLRLFCFPYAGGGASIFREWQQAMPGDIQVSAIQLPGRENRINETPANRLRDVVDHLSQVLTPYCDIPFVFFGHSLGAKIAFELVRALRRKGGQQPLHLLVSGARAPHMPEPFPLHHLPDEGFIDGLRRYSAMPEEVLRNKELMSLFMPVLRADFSLDETYEYYDDAPISCPITAFGGTEDHEISREELLAWKQYTTDDFTWHTFPGDHFFIKSSQKAFLGTITEVLGSCSAHSSALMN